MVQKRRLKKRAERECREAQEHYLQAKAMRDQARQRRDWILWENSDRIKRKTAAEITGLSLGGVGAAIRRGEVAARANEE